MKALRRTCMTSLFALAGAAAFAPAVAAAQDAPAPEPAGTEDAQEEGPGDVIIVTAQRREEAQRDVPISITTIGGAALERANIVELPDIAEVTPGLRFDFAGSFFQPTIRGIGTSITTSGSAALHASSASTSASPVRITILFRAIARAS